MSDLPVLPLWVTKYEGKTAHLSLEEDGAYTRLLRLCWRTPGCTIPSDAAWIMRQMRVDQAAYERAVRPVLEEFFVLKNGRWQSLRLLAEFTSANTKHQARKMAGKMGGLAKARKTNETEPSDATISPEQNAGKPYPKPEPHPQKEESEKEEASASSKKRVATRLPDDWTPPASWIAWATAFADSDGRRLTASQIASEAAKFPDYWRSQPGSKAVKTDWQATWKNWVRTACERHGRVVAPVDDGQPAGQVVEAVMVDGKRVLRPRRVA